MQPFESVREQLLKAGIAAGAVSRYVTELREHLADLTNRERGNGADAQGAANKARTLMGSDAQLVQAMLDRNPPRALSVKAPWAVFGVLPVATIIAVTWLIAMLMIRLLMPVRAMLPSEMPDAYQALIAAATLVSGYLLGPLLAAGCIWAALRQRLTSAWVWTGLALIALFSGFFAFHASSGPGDPYRAANVIVTHGHVNGAATLALITARAGALFALSALAWQVLRQRVSAA